MEKGKSESFTFYPLPLPLYLLTWLMSETFAQLRVLIFLLLIFGFTVGVVSKKKITRFIAGMIFMPTLVAIVFHYIKQVRAAMDPTSSLLFTIGILVVGLILVLRFLLGKDIWHSVAGDFVYDVLKWIFFLPFRIVRGLFALFRRK